MADSEPRRDAQAADITAPAQPFDDGVDETLVDLMLEQSISDRLRSLSAYVNALARFRPV